MKLPVSWHHARLCVLVSHRHESMYVKLVEALCAEQQINPLKFHDNKDRGDGWASVKMTVRGNAAERTGWLRLCGSEGQR